VLKVGIIGATGYTGAELLRILHAHRAAEVVLVTSREQAGRDVSELYPNLRGFSHLKFSEPTPESIADLDVAFFATPHGVAQAMMANFHNKNLVVIDLSADFRIRDIATWEQWYGQPHQATELVANAVYGLPEFNRAEIRNANLIACPGCYPTSIQLGLMPLLKAGVIKLDNIIANSASGVTGAGRSAKVANLFTEVADSYKPYSSSGHRHLPEIRQALSDIAQSDVGVTFVPHLLPMARGILSTIYVELTEDINAQTLFESFYSSEQFVDVLPAGMHPETRWVTGTNLNKIAVSKAPDTNNLIVMSVIDNLGKGASGQAVQCMNIRFGLPEMEGLDNPAIAP